MQLRNALLREHDFIRIRHIPKPVGTAAFRDPGAPRNEECHATSAIRVLWPENSTARNVAVIEFGLLRKIGEQTLERT